jgi:hypothetical protein
MAGGGCHAVARSGGGAWGASEVVGWHSMGGTGPEPARVGGRRALKQNRGGGI